MVKMTRTGVVEVMVMVAMLVVVGVAQGQLVIDTTDDGFQISFQGIKILEHTAEDPVVWLGYGSANFSEQHGNFQIEDQVAAKFPLSTFLQATVHPGLIKLVLQSDQDPTLSFELVLSAISGNQLDISSTSTYSGDTPYDRIWVRLWAEGEEEAVWGAGEQYTYLNLRGRHFPIWTSEQGVGRDGGIIANVTDVDGGAGGEYYTTYWPQASFLSSRRHSLLIQDRHYLVLNFTEADRHEVMSHNDVFRATLLTGASLMETVQTLTKTLGTQPRLPDWLITGTTLGLQRGTDEMLYYYEEAKAAGANISALWIQDWSGAIQTYLGYRVYWNWRWNQTYYPDLDVAIQDLAAEGVRVMAYINPSLIEGGEMFEEAAALGHLMTDIDGEVYRQDMGGFLVGRVDLLDTAARDWYRDEMIKNMVDLGLAGWMADFGEYTNLDMFSDNTYYDDQERHNLIPVEWARCNREVVEHSANLGEVVPFMRSGGLGSSSHMLLAWAGDQNVDWSFGDGLPSTIIAALSLSMSGMGVIHFDIGGYTTQTPVLRRSKELLLRSAEYAVFTPVMRSHTKLLEYNEKDVTGTDWVNYTSHPHTLTGNHPESNHQFYSSEDTLLQFSRLTQMHARLTPYTRALLQDLETEGTPVQRPLFLDFEGDTGSLNATYQYMYGPDLLVAPVLYKEADSQTVYLPGGTSWVHLWEGEGSGIPGPTTTTVPAPQGYPPVFYRHDSPWAALFQEIRQEFGAAGPWAL